KCIIAIAHLPETRRVGAGEQGAVGQHRQIEAGAVPGHEVRRVALDTVEEALYQLAFGAAELAEAPHPEGLAAAQRAGDRHDPLLLRRQEVAARALPAQRKHRFGDLPIREPLQPVQAAAEIDIRHGLDVEHQGIHAAFMSTATATTRPRSSLKVTWASPTPRP